MARAIRQVVLQVGHSQVVLPVAGKAVLCAKVLATLCTGKTKVSTEDMAMPVKNINESIEKIAAVDLHKQIAAAGDSSEDSSWSKLWMQILDASSDINTLAAMLDRELHKSQDAAAAAETQDQAQHSAVVAHTTEGQEEEAENINIDSLTQLSDVFHGVV